MLSLVSPPAAQLAGFVHSLVTEWQWAMKASVSPGCAAVQLSHSIDWFASTYDNTCKPIPILIHKSAELRKDASARTGTRVITFDQLAALRAAVTDAFASLAADNAYCDPRKVGPQLIERNLNAKSFVERWGMAPRK